jgi:hypothetical protein
MCTVMEKIIANENILELPSYVRIHPVFYVNNRRFRPTATLRLHIHVTTPKHDDEYDVGNIYVVNIDIFQGRRGN